MSELTFVQKIAYGFLEHWINDNYVPRPVIQEYTKYMSRDHDFMDKTQDYFDNSRGQCTPCILLHREECKLKLRPMPIPQPTNVGKGYWP